MFIKTLSLHFSESISSNDFSDVLEEAFLELPDLQYEIQATKILVWNENFLNNENISFADYLEAGKILKNFGIQNELFTEEDYKNFFKMEKLEREEPLPRGQVPSADALDAMIATVDKNDPKLLDALAQLDKLRKK